MDKKWLFGGRETGVRFRRGTQSDSTGRPVNLRQRKQLEKTRVLMSTQKTGFGKLRKTLADGTRIVTQYINGPFGVVPITWTEAPLVAEVESGFIFSIEWYTVPPYDRVRARYAKISNGKWRQILPRTLIDTPKLFTNWWNATGEGIITFPLGTFVSGSVQIYPYYYITSPTYGRALWTDPENLNETMEVEFNLTGIGVLSGSLVATEYNGGIWYKAGSDWKLVSGTDELFKADEVEPYAMAYQSGGRFSPDGKKGYVGEFIKFGDQTRVSFDLQKTETGEIALTGSSKVVTALEDNTSVPGTVNETASCSRSWDYAGEPGLPICARAEVDYPLNCPFGSSCDDHTWRRVTYPGGVYTSVITLKATDSTWWEPTDTGGDCAIKHEEARWSPDSRAVLLTDSQTQNHQYTSAVSLPSAVKIPVAADYTADNSLVEALMIVDQADYAINNSREIITIWKYGSQGGYPIDLEDLNYGIVFSESRDWISQDLTTTGIGNYSKSSLVNLVLKEGGEEVFSKTIINASAVQTYVAADDYSAEYFYLSSDISWPVSLDETTTETYQIFKPIGIDPRSKTVVGISTTLTVTGSYSGSAEGGSNLEPPLDEATLTYSWTDFVIEVYSEDKSTSMVLEGSAGSIVDDYDHLSFGVGNHASASCSTQPGDSDSYSTSTFLPLSTFYSMLYSAANSYITFTQNGDFLLHFYDKQFFYTVNALRNIYAEDEKIIIIVSMIYDAEDNSIIPISTISDTIEDLVTGEEDLIPLFGVFRQSELDEMNYVYTASSQRTHHNT
jgi:hypothetical protein